MVAHALFSFPTIHQDMTPIHLSLTVRIWLGGVDCGGQGNAQLKFIRSPSWVVL